VAELSPFLNDHMKAVQVGFPEASLLDFKEFGILKFLEIGPHAALPRTHIDGECMLTRIDGAVGPRVFEQHCVRELGPNREILVGEDEVGDHRKAVSRGRICADEFDIAARIFKRGSNVIHAWNYSVPTPLPCQATVDKCRDDATPLVVLKAVVRGAIQEVV
jgi:hypothetical protein